MREEAGDSILQKEKGPFGERPPKVLSSADSFASIIWIRFKGMISAPK